MDSNKYESHSKKAKICFDLLSGVCVVLVYLALMGGILKLVVEQSPAGRLDAAKTIPVAKQRPTEIYVQSCPSCKTQEAGDE